MRKWKWLIGGGLILGALLGSGSGEASEGDGEHPPPDPTPGNNHGITGADQLPNSSRSNADRSPYDDQPPSPPPDEPVLVFPVKGARITRGFGWQKKAGGTGKTWHGAVDIPAAVGTPIRAIAAGRVWQAKESESSSCGHRVQMACQDSDVPFSFYATYCHMDELHVSEGELVQKGQVIGTVGWSGNVVPKSPQGAHLHMAMYASSWKQPFDPGPWVGLSG